MHLVIFQSPSQQETSFWGRREPGSGEFNLRNILRHLRDSGYDGHVTCEYFAGFDEAETVPWLNAT